MGEHPSGGFASGKFIFCSKLVFRKLMNLKAFSLVLACVALLSDARAADVSAYGVLKGQEYTQTTTGQPVLSATQGYQFRAFVSVSDTGDVNGASVRTPAGASVDLDYDPNAMDEARFVAETSAASAAQLNATYPAGTYTFQIDAVTDGIKFAVLSLGADAYPAAAPSILNVAAAQNVDANSNFTVSWSPIAGATANDRIELRITDSNGFDVYDTPSLSKPDALPGTVTSFNISAGTLNENEQYTAHVRFLKIARNTTSYPGAVGMTGFYAETSFALSTGAVGGGTDTTPPVLVSTSPQNGATGVSAQSPILFTFNEAMAAGGQNIAWSGNLDASKFFYFWSGDKKILTAFYQGNLPAGATITWRLNPTSSPFGNFKDLAGNELPVNVFAGSFSTAGGSTTTNSPPSASPSDYCHSGVTNEPGNGAYTLFKTVNYVQTNNAAPVIDPELGATFASFLNPRTNQSYSSASITIPGGSTRSLSNFFGSYYFLYQTFPSQAALDAAFPNGLYHFTGQVSGGGQVGANITLPENSYPPVPQVLNLAELQGMNPNADFTLRWNPFTAAGQYDMISLEIHNQTDSEVFYAPDFCLPRPLPNTATSIVIPAGTFKTSGQFEGTLRFSRLAALDTNSIPGSSGVAGIAVSTSFGFQVGSTNQTSAPKWTGFHRNSDNSVDLQLSGPANKTYIIEASSNLTQWTAILTTNSPSGSVNYHDAQAGLTPYRFFRARMQ